MRLQQDLQVKLRHRLRRLLTVTHEGAAHETRLVADWIAMQPSLVASLTAAARVEPELEIEDWLSKIYDMDGGLWWPSETEEGRATSAWAFVQHIADADRASTQAGYNLVSRLVFGVTRIGNYNDAWQGTVEKVITPLFDFLDERVGDESSVLYVLERYVHRVEWFDRDDLYAKYLKQTASGEEVYNLDLQRFLYLDAGIVTYAKARAARGEPDLVGQLETDDPLICDGKLFTDSKSYLAKGVHQVAHDAQTYQKSVAYLVINNLSERPLELPTDGDPNVWPPYVDVVGVRVYLVQVRALKTKSSSKLGKPSPVRVTRADLVDPDAT